MALDRSLRQQLARGLVVHLDPDELLKNGATHTATPDTRVQGQHFFACLGVEGESCRLLPLFTNAGPNREELPREGRVGHAKWTEGTFHYYPNQVWTAAKSAVTMAAAEAHDKSTRNARNSIAPAALPEASQESPPK
jgi:hypothetical protein